MAPLLRHLRSPRRDPSLLLLGLFTATLLCGVVLFDDRWFIPFLLEPYPRFGRWCGSCPSGERRPSSCSSRRFYRIHLRTKTRWWAPSSSFIFSVSQEALLADIPRDIYNELIGIVILFPRVAREIVQKAQPKNASLHSTVKVCLKIQLGNAQSPIHKKNETILLGHKTLPRWNVIFKTSGL